MIERLLAWTGYYIGLGIEGGIILIAAVLLALMLTGVLFAWISAIKVKVAESKERSAQRKAEKEAERQEREAQKQAEAEARAQAQAEAEAAEAAAEAEAALAEEAEEAEEPEEEAVEETEPVEEEAEEEPEPELEEEPEEEVKPKKKKGKKAEVVEEETEEETEEADVGNVTVVHDGIVFNDSKTITELYEELTSEQKSYFDELREEALTKPDAELSISRNFITVKIGKRNLIKLLIKRGVTVAEFMLENEALKQLRLSNKNKRGGKSSIKVKPTTVQVIDLMSLKVAVDMITLAYEEIMLDD